MKNFLLFLLILLIGGGAYYYFTETETYEMATIAAEREYRLSLRELGDKKKELESLIEQTAQTALAPDESENEETFPAVQPLDPSEDLSKDIANLKNTANNQPDLKKRKQALQQLLETATNKQTALEQNIEKRVRDNYLLMEQRRTKAYQAFEKRMAADKTKLSEGKGERYAREKKELDKKAVDYQNAVNNQNEKLRAKIRQRREQLSALEEKIQHKINLIDTLLTGETISTENRQQLDEDITETPPPSENTSPDQQHVTALRQELIALDISARELDDQHNKKIKTLKDNYDDVISTIKFFGGGGLFILIFLIFLCHLIGKHHE